MSYTPPNPWLWYTFKDNYGTTVSNKGTAGPSMDGTLMNNAVCSNMDYAINGMSLSLVNTPTKWGNDPTGQYISIPSFTFGGSGFSWSFSCWFKKNSDIVNQQWSRIFDFCSVVGTDTFLLAFYNDLFEFAIVQNGWNTREINKTVCDGIWHHIVICAIDTVYTFYIDNVVVLNTTLPTMVNSTRTINYIGRSNYNNPYANILIDDFRIYSGYCLTTTDIAYLYNLRPILMYDFEYVTGVVVPNMGSLGTSYNGNLSNTMTSINTTTSAIGINCLSISTTKTSGYMSIPSLTFSDPTYHWSICFWYNITYISGGNTENYNLLCLGNSVSTNICIKCINNGNLILLINNTYFPICASSCYDGVWRHVALVYNATTTTISIYFNGVMCMYPITTTAITNISRPMYIGDNTFLISDSNTYNTTTLFIDDFRLYNNILLSINEISQICGNNVLRTTNSGLLNTILNAYIPNTTMASTSSYYTKLGKNTVNLNTIYSNSYSYLGTNTSFNNGNFKPTSITGCCLFLSAEKENVILNNGNVQQWTDLSGNNNHAIQNTVTNQPLYKTNDSYMNNNPSVFFNGSYSYSQLTATCNNLSSLTACTICLVLYANACIYQNTILSSSIGGGVNMYRLLLQSNSHNLQNTINNGTNITSGYTMTDFVPTVFIVSMNFTNSTSLLVTSYTNGITGNSWTIGATDYINLSMIDIGNWLKTSPMTGAISSIIIYNSVLTQTQRQQVEGYLTWKWLGNNIFTLSHPYYRRSINDISNLYNQNTYIINTASCGIADSNYKATGFTNGTLYFGNTVWTNYAIMISGAPYTRFPISCQVTYTNVNFTIINASLIFAVDDNLNALYINNNNIITFNQYGYGAAIALNITLLPGKNIIDAHMRNVAGNGYICFYIKDTNNTLLCQTDANTKCRYL